MIFFNSLKRLKIVKSKYLKIFDFFEFELKIVLSVFLVFLCLDKYRYSTIKDEFYLINFNKFNFYLSFHFNIYTENLTCISWPWISISLCFLWINMIEKSQEEK